MQLHLSLVTFEYQGNRPVRTVLIDGDPWFYALDVCVALGLANPRDALSRLDQDERRTVGSADSSTVASRTNPSIISESGLYNLVFQSRTDESKKFKKWVTKDVLPQIRKTGAFGRSASAIPAFVRRFNDNWDRVEAGHFSVISELFIRVYGRFEQLGHRLAERGPDGKELRPDVSVGKTFCTHLKDCHPEHSRSFKMYSHLLPDGMEVQARQYPNELWPIFTAFVDTVWLRDYAPEYLGARDVKALQLLPKLLPPPSARHQKDDVAQSKFHKLKEHIRNIPDLRK